jgi:hypothetical protein
MVSRAMRVRGTKNSKRRKKTDPGGGRRVSKA